MKKRIMLLLSHTEIEQRLNISLNQLFDICQQWNIKEMALFGSILRDDFNNKSDIDFLISFYLYLYQLLWQLIP